MPCSLGVMGYGSDSGTRCSTSRFSTSISKPPGARCSARILPVTTMDDSCVRFLMVSNSSSGRALFTATHCMSAVAVAHNRKRDLAGAAQVVEPAGDLDGFADVRAGFGDSNSRNHDQRFAAGARRYRSSSRRKLPSPSPADWTSRALPSAPAAADIAPARLRSSSMVFFQSMVPPSPEQRKQVAIVLAVVVVHVRGADAVLHQVRTPPPRLRPCWRGRCRTR